METFLQILIINAERIIWIGLATSLDLDWRRLWIGIWIGNVFGFGIGSLALATSLDLGRLYLDRIGNVFGFGLATSLEWDLDWQRLWISNF